jgi:hypothetical protein
MQINLLTPKPVVVTPLAPITEVMTTCPYADATLVRRIAGEVLIVSDWKEKASM